MNNNALKVIAAFTTCFSAACTSYESSSNAHLAREYLTEDLEDQIMFNLIRGMNGLPIVHYDIGNIQSAIAAKVTPQVGGGTTTVHNNYPTDSTSTVTSPGKALSTTITTAVGAASAVVGTVTRPFTYGATAERDNNVTVTISPVFDEPKIYAAYAKFLNVDKRHTGTTPTPKPSTSVTKTTTETKTEKTVPESGAPPPPPGTVIEVKPKVIETVTVESSNPKEDDSENTTKIKRFGAAVKSIVVADSKPNENLCIPHTLKHWNNKWYYISPDYINEFSALCMAVVARNPNVTGSATAAGGKKAAADVKVQQRILMDSINRTQGVF